MSHNTRLIFIVLIVVTLLGCQTKSIQDPKNYSDSLIVLSGATNINYAKVNKTDQVTYNLKADYPAAEIINQLLKKLGNMGWTPLNEDFLNPGLPTSFVRGWSDYEDISKKPNMKVHSWLSDWQNRNGDVLVYGLRYQYPINAQPDMSSMNIVAIFIPVDVAKAALEYLRNSNQKNSSGK